MFNTTLSLKDHKDKKKFHKIVTDIESILKVLTLSQEGLKHFKEYTSVQELISVMETNKNILLMHKKKYEVKLKDIQDIITNEN